MKANNKVFSSTNIQRNIILLIILCVRASYLYKGEQKEIMDLKEVDNGRQSDLSWIKTQKKRAPSTKESHFVQSACDGGEDGIDDRDHYFKPIHKQQPQQQQYRLRESQSLNSLSLFDISPLVERATSFEYLNYRTSGSVFSSSGSDCDHREQLCFSDTDNEEDFLSIYSSKK